MQEWSIFYSESTNIISTSHYENGDAVVGVLFANKSEYFNTITRFDHSHTIYDLKIYPKK